MMFLASFTSTRQLQYDMNAISLALALKEGDQSGNQQAQMSICLFLFCRFSHACAQIIEVHTLNAIK